jgi:hypothetical protein
MSMRNSGASGYVVALFDLKNVIGDENMDKVIAATDTEGCEEITELVNSFLPKGFPLVESVFVLGDEDESEDLEQHVWYAFWDESDLFELKPRPELYALRNSNVWPERKNWVMFG